ncbi:MAG: Cytochrome c biosis protein Ccs1 [Planctomycetota bacterium]
MPAALRPIVDLFSSVRFGIVLLVLLFVYMSVGSAGLLYPIHPNLFHPDAWVHAQVRQWRPFEMTEFEWFHWWPFDLLLALLAANLVVTTVRRIPLRTVNLGVWMIHSGIILLIVGSVIYFGTKVEGEVPVARRAVTVGVLEDLGDGEPAQVTASASMLAMPGSRVTVGEGDSRYELEVQSIDPEWEILTGEEAGTRAYSVTLTVTAPGKRFLRQLVAGRPQYTEDLLITDDPAQPVKRAIKETGRALVDERLFVALDYGPAEWFYLKNELAKSWALYVRRPGDRRWVERPIHGLPLYNDWVGDDGELFAVPGAAVGGHPIDVSIPAVAADDPAPEVTLSATGYLRYAQWRARWREAGPDAAPNPVAMVSVADREGRSAKYTLVGGDPQRRAADGGVIALRSIQDEEQLAAFRAEPSLSFRVPSAGIEVSERVKDAALADRNAPWKALGSPELGYGYRVVAVQDDLVIRGREVSVAIIELRTPKGEFRRWVFSDPTMSRDIRPGEDPMAAMQRGGEDFVDAAIDVEYRPGNGLALALLVAGPEAGRLRLVDALGRTEARVLDVEPRRPVELAAGVTMTVQDWMPNAVEDVRPAPVPPDQRQRDARELLSMMRLSVPGRESAAWLQYHPYPFDGPEQMLRRYWYRPTTVELADGSSLEVMFSRQRLPLPSPVALESFELATHVGGFSGQSSSIRNYTSVVRFRSPDGTWGAPERLSVNAPVEHGGYSYFQSQWDPPDDARPGSVASAGLNYTVLGVGNRHGVWIQLAGCVVACIGMAYAFYVKPVIKRRQRESVLAEIERARAEGRAPRFPRHLSESVHA